MSVSVQGRLPARRHGGMRSSRSLSVLAREMPARLTRPARRNCSVRFDQLEVAEAARSTRHCPRAQALVDNRLGGGDSFATPVALVHVALDRHQVSPSAASSRKLPLRHVCPVPEPAKRGAPCPPRRRPPVLSGPQVAASAIRAVRCALTWRFWRSFCAGRRGVRRLVCRTLASA
jgi:hypothetical protein